MCFSYRKVVYLLSHSNNDLIGFGFGLGLGKEKRTPDGSPLSIKQNSMTIFALINVSSCWVKFSTTNRRRKIKMDEIDFNENDANLFEESGRKF